MSYESIARFAQQGGSIYFALLFVVVLIYAFWPRNKKGFEEASRIPFNEEN